MNLPAKVAHQVARSSVLTALATISSIVSLAIFLYQSYISQSTSLSATLFFVVLVSVFIAFCLYSLRIREENRSLQDIAENFREINGIYRDKLYKLFFGDNPVQDQQTLVVEERATISAVCQRIAQIYFKIIGKECVVTVKVLTKNNNRLYATTYARSVSNSERDKTMPQQFEVGTGQNTTFDQALMPNTVGKISHFYSGDLKKHQNYNNQRQEYWRQYQSAIVVPIRCCGLKKNRNWTTSGSCASILDRGID